MPDIINQSGLRELAQHLEYTTAKKLEQVSIPINPTSGQVAMVLDGYKIEDLKKYLPERPAIKEVEETMTDIDSFIEYLSERKTAHSRVFANLESKLIEAIIDYHPTPDQNGVDLASWCKNRCVLKLQHSIQYHNWYFINGKMMTQLDFSEFLKDNCKDIISPSGSSIVEMVMHLEATAEMKYTAKMPTNEGMLINYKEDINAMGAGERVKIPNTIIIAIPIFNGSPNTEFECEFKLRINQGLAQFGIKIIGLDRVVLESIKSTINIIKEKTGVKVFI